MTPSPRDPAAGRRAAQERAAQENATGGAEQGTRAGRRTVLRFAGAGVELAGMVLGAGFLGHLLDRYMLGMERPWGLICGGLIGFAVGMSHLLVLANRFNR